MVRRVGLLSGVCIIVFLLAAVVFAHSDQSDIITRDYLITEENVRTSSVKVVIGASILVAILTVISLLNKDMSSRTKAFLFWSLAVVITLSTVYVAGSTIYLNMVSVTKGPVHWHSDFEMWKCGEKLDLANPAGLSNRIGTPVFHEHGDNRVHVEGVVVRHNDVDFHTFFDAIGGSLENNRIVFPVHEGMVSVENGDLCSGEPGTLQAFLYRVQNPDPTVNTGFVYTQEKIENFEDYVLAPYINVPPGDCIILEFDVEKERTDRICESYRVAEENGDLSYNGAGVFGAQDDEGST
jgi:hypothetical protein